MKIDIVTPYGNNKFDLGVNEVTALIQKAYEYSEKKREEGPEQKGGSSHPSGSRCGSMGRCKR